MTMAMPIVCRGIHSCRAYTTPDYGITYSKFIELLRPSTTRTSYSTNHWLRCGLSTLNKDHGDDDDEVQRKRKYDALP